MVTTSSASARAFRFQAIQYQHAESTAREGSRARLRGFRQEISALKRANGADGSCAAMAIGNDRFEWYQLSCIQAQEPLHHLYIWVIVHPHFADRMFDDHCDSPSGGNCFSAANPWPICVPCSWRASLSGRSTPGYGRQTELRHALRSLCAQS